MSLVLNGEHTVETLSMKYLRLAGPHRPTDVAAVAGIPGSTLRSWDDRGFINARELLSEFFAKTGGRVAQAMKLKAKLEANGEDASWIEETLKDLKGTRQFEPPELLQVCALAELGRYGISPKRAQGDGNEGYLLAALTRDLYIRVFDTPASPDDDLSEPRFLVAEIRNLDSASMSIQSGLTPDGLRDYIATRDSAAVMWIAVDVVGLLKRIVSRLEERKRKSPNAQQS